MSSSEPPCPFLGRALSSGFSFFIVDQRVDSKDFASKYLIPLNLPDFPPFSPLIPAQPLSRLLGPTYNIQALFKSKIWEIQRENVFVLEHQTYYDKSARCIQSPDDHYSAPTYIGARINPPTPFRQHKRGKSTRVAQKWVEFL